jgi:hypothetical protein
VSAKLKPQATPLGATHNSTHLAKSLFTLTVLDQHGLSQLITGAGYRISHTGQLDRLISNISNKKSPRAANSHQIRTKYGLV